MRWMSLRGRMGIVGALGRWSVCLTALSSGSRWSSARLAAAGGRRIVVAQDTTEVNFPGRQSRGLGPAGRAQTPVPGFFIHALVAVDAEAEAVLGLVDAQIWTRPQDTGTARPPQQAQRPPNSRTRVTSGLIGGISMRS